MFSCVHVKLVSNSRKALSFFKTCQKLPFLDIAQPFSRSTPRFVAKLRSRTLEGDIGMRTVEKTRCQLASLRAGGRFSNPERVKNTELEAGLGGGGQCGRFKSWHPTRRCVLPLSLSQALSYEPYGAICKLNWSTAGGAGAVQKPYEVPRRLQ